MGNTKLGHSCALIVCRCHSRMPPPFIHPMTTRPLKHQCCSSHPSVVNCEWRCFISCSDEDFAYWEGKESEANRAFHLENRLTPDTLYSSYIAFKDIAFGTSFTIALFKKKTNYGNSKVQPNLVIASQAAFEHDRLNEGRALCRSCAVTSAEPMNPRPSSQQRDWGRKDESSKTTRTSLGYSVA